ncbi:MAG: hypothetical protein IJL97_04850 [Lachnospiraceae bacterium]|nr:hypothetical protein [Lachnospiraceae bacterium]
MAKQVYSFTKIKKDRTTAGIYATIIGMIALVLIAVLIGLAVYTDGNVSSRMSVLSYISFFVALLGLYIAGSARRDSDTYGRMIKAGVIINALALIVNAVIFFIGIFNYIM